MSVVSLNSYDAVAKTRYPFWRLEITNWGNRGSNADTTSLVYPAGGDRQAGPNIPGGGQLIMIGPDSTVDEFIVDYNELLTPGTWGPPSPGVLSQQSFTVGIHRPIVGVPGPMIYRVSPSGQYGDTYIKDGVTGNAQLGTNAVFESPRLQVITYIQPPSVLPFYTKRADMVRSLNEIIEDAGGAEETMGIWPVMGRRAMAVYVRASGTLEATVRVGRIAATSTRIQEETVASGAVNGTTAAQFCAVTSKPASFLALYATWTAGVGGIIATMIASDEASGDTHAP